MKQIVTIVALIVTFACVLPIAAWLIVDALTLAVSVIFGVLTGTPATPLIMAER